MKRMIGIMVLALGVIGCDDSVAGPSVEDPRRSRAGWISGHRLESTPCQLVHVECRLLSATSAAASVHVVRQTVASDDLCGGAEVRLNAPFDDG